MAAGKHLILATVIDVLPGQMIYPACVTCYTKLHLLSDSNQLQCQRCGKLYGSDQIYQRYRLTLRVTSQSDSREVTVFGSCLDPFIGVNATILASYLEHTLQVHASSNDLLHDSIIKTLVGHPFYFGFKTSPAQRNNFTGPSLADIMARDHESLVAVQMTSPFQQWNFPTVVQYLQKTVERLGHAPCGECGICRVIPVSHPRHQHERVKYDDAEDTIEKGGVNVEGFEITCSRLDATCDETTSSNTTLHLGETVFSCSIPSFRLSCDKSMSTTEEKISSRLLNSSHYQRNLYQTDSSSTKYQEDFPREIHKDEYTPPIYTSDDMDHQEISKHNLHKFKSFKEGIPVVATSNRAECGMCIKGNLLEEGGRNKVNGSNSCAVTTDNGEDEFVTHNLEECQQDVLANTNKDNGRSKDTFHPVASREIGLELDVVGINDSSIIQECEEFMNKWLEENSLDRWSYRESIENSSINLRGSPNLDTNALKVEDCCRTEARENDKGSSFHEVDPSRTCMSQEFLDDLPFSEALDQFLYDIEDEQPQSRGRGSSNSQHLAHTKGLFSGTINSHKGTSSALKSKRSSEAGRTEGRPNGRTETGGNATAQTSGLVKYHTETDVCYAKDSEIIVNPVHDIKCNTNEGNEKEEQRESQSIKEDNEDFNKRNRNHGTDCYCDDGTVLSDSSKQKQQPSPQKSRRRKLDECICESRAPSHSSLQSEQSSCDYSQSPLLFSQSQSPILLPKPSKFLPSQQPRSLNIHGLCADDTENMVPILHSTTPHLRNRFHHSRKKLNKPSDGNQQGTATDDSSNDQQIPDQGTPCLFFQITDDPIISSRPSPIPTTGNFPKVFHSRQKATPLRQLFLQRARSWKMSSTPMTSKKTTARESSFESPLSSGTPNLFSPETSLENTSSNLGQLNHSKEREESIPNSFEYTPDLF
ncbi:uncharacterized protein LOC121410828 [Lytechinus variegatus]|uniref:uncharacterized protein LOC121410828 n=1 Tax=Lytechinus variegatus TaxID=7654 RepID=UPI001BB2A358|nr:uncharacterized protein LOC121410828 [Lytechinus variegatus]XP_041459087.1 uncharacterized protein LOC121410828 [Lytechinus variegatus]